MMPYIRDDTTIVTGSREDFLGPLFCSWLASPNAGKWPILVSDTGQISPAFRANLSAIPGVSFTDLRGVREDSEKRLPGKTLHQQTYITKVAAIRRCPTRYAVWFDHDVEILGDITPIVEHAIASGKWLAAPSYASFPTRLRHNRHATQNAVLVVDTYSPNLRIWHKTMKRDFDDETSLCTAFGNVQTVQAMICDINRPEWFLAPNYFFAIDFDRRRGLPNACLEMARFAASGATLPILIHWGSVHAKPFFQARYPFWRYLVTPPEPQEEP